MKSPFFPSVKKNQKKCIFISYPLDIGEIAQVLHKLSTILK